MSSRPRQATHTPWLLIAILAAQPNTLTSSYQPTALTHAVSDILVGGLNVVVDKFKASTYDRVKVTHRRAWKDNDCTTNHDAFFKAIQDHHIPQTEQDTAYKLPSPKNVMRKYIIHPQAKPYQYCSC
jgi:hypothetical protein